MYDCVMGPCQDGAVIDHLGINCADWEKSKAFYDEVLGALGYTRQLDYHVAIGYGHDSKPDFWIADMNAGEASGPNREVHVAFHARNRDAVQSFYDTALKLGAESLHEPRLWPTPATTAPSSATRTATTSKRSSTTHRRSDSAPG